MWRIQKRNAEILFSFDYPKRICRVVLVELDHLASSSAYLEPLWASSLLQGSLSLSSRPTFLPTNCSGKTPGPLPGFSSLFTNDASNPVYLLITSVSVLFSMATIGRTTSRVPQMIYKRLQCFLSCPLESILHPATRVIFCKT